MDRALRPKLSFYSILAQLLGLGLTIALFLFLGSLLCGCASIKGQTAIDYTGVVEFRSLVMPPDVRNQPSNRSGGPVVSYWDTPTYGKFFVRNGQHWGMRFLLDCGNYEPTVEVPALTEQVVLVETTPAHSNRDLCVVRESSRLR